MERRGRLRQGSSAVAAVALAAVLLTACRQAPGTIATRAGNGSLTISGDGGPATAAGIGGASLVAVDGTGTVYIDSVVDTYYNPVVPQRSQIRRIAPDGTISTLIDDAGVTCGLVATPDGTLYFARNQANIVRRTPDGVITPVATLAGGIISMALLPNGNLAVPLNNTIAEVDVTTGTVTTIAGTGAAGFSGDGGPAAAAALDAPVSIAVTPDGTMYIGESFNPRVRRIDGATGVITTIAGTGTPAAVAGSGEGGPATAANLQSVFGLAVGTDGSVFLSEPGLHDVRRVSPDGTITTVTGTGVLGSTGDGGPATAAALNSPFGLAFDAQGILLVADSRDNRVRSVAPPFN